MTEAAHELLKRIDGATLLHAAPDAWLIVDTDGVIRAFNDKAPTMFDVAPDVLEGSAVETLLPDAMRERHRGLRSGYVASAIPRSMGVGLDLLARRADGSTFPVDISLSPVHIDGELFVIAAVRDVTEATELQTRLRVVQQEAALTEDRERLARDLHDTVIQEVFAVGLALQSVSGRTDDPVVQSRLHQSIADLDRVIRDIRTAIFGMTDPAAHSGVRRELLRIVAAERKALGFEPHLEFEGAIDELDPVIADQLAPTLREALSNVARHAGATSCDVTLRADGSKVELVVIDDGRGPAEDPGKGRGLINMATRAEALGGSCTLIPGPSVGAELRWMVPAGD